MPGTNTIHNCVSTWYFLINKKSTEDRFDKIHGISVRVGFAGQRATMLGADRDGGDAAMYPQGTGNDPGDLYGMGAYSIPGMASQASPLRNAGISGATVPGNSAVITSSGKSVAGKVTSTPATEVKKPEKKKKKNKVLGFLKGAADFLILDDVKTVFDPNASILDKGLAIFSVTPAGKALKAGRFGLKLINKSSGGKLVNPKKIDNVTSKVPNNRPANLTPEGAGRNGAFREAKRNGGISVSQRPKKVTSAVDRRGNKTPDDLRQNRGPYINGVDGGHYD